MLRPGWSTDALYWVVTILLVKPLRRVTLILPVGILLLVGVTTGEVLRSGGYRGFGPLSHQPVWLQAIQIYLLVDFCGYWIHRVFHRGRWWPFHAVHHSSEQLDWFAGVRVHPVNDLVNKLAQATPVLLLGYDPAVTLSTAPVLTLYAILLHARIDYDFGPLRAAIASPAFHRWHHSREALGKNFAGLFPLWDILFGTYYLPRGRWPADFGIDEEIPGGFLRQMRWPFLSGESSRTRRARP